MASYQRDGLGSSAAPPIVAIMGVTGSGKTSFISNAISRRLRTGDSLLSCTQEIQVFEYQSTSPPGHLILADTPGFDDTQKSDIEILEEFVAFIKGKPLAGIIYLHRINDNRMQGSAMKNLQLLAEVCGDDFLENLILVTTMWDLVNPSIGEARHNSLAEEFWRPLTERGAKLERYDSERAPARILRRFLNQRPSGRGMLEIQRESVCEGKQLGETRAGRTILDNMERERGRAEEFLNHLNQETNIAESHSEREQLQRERSKWREKRDRLSNLIERYTHRGGSHELQSDMGYYGQPSTLNAGFASNSLSIFAAERQYSNRTPMPRRSNVEPRESWGSRPRSADVSNSSRSFEPDRSFDHRPSIRDDRCPRSNSLVYTPSNERWNEPNERKAEEQPDPEYEKPPDEWRHYYR